MKVALVFLTWNRLDFVKRAVEHNVKFAGYPIEKIVWVDNGSTDGVDEWAREFLKDYNHVYIHNEENEGVARGYNKIYKNVGDVDLVARPSSDMCGPENWLKTMVEYHNDIPNTGITAMISDSFKDKVSTRYIGEPISFSNGKTIVPANALGSICFNKEILDRGIFLPENLTNYGYEDTLWTNETRKAGYLNYYVPGIFQDFPQEELQKYGDYVKWKGDEIRRAEREHSELLELNKNING